MRKVCISTVDTNVIVIALSKFYELSIGSLEELWVKTVLMVFRLTIVYLQ